MIKRFASVFLAIILFSSCDKDDEVARLSGQYTGTFISWNNDPAVDSYILTGNTSITFSGQEYTSTGNPDRVPAGGSGIFEVNDDVAKFSDKNVWPANFDWQLILNGEYELKIKSDSLFLTKHIGYNHYQYKLKRSKN